MIISIFFKKIWGYAKKYWYVFALAATTVLFILMRKDNSHLVEVLKFKLEKNKEEIDQLNAIKKEKSTKQKNAELQAEKELKRIKEEYKLAKDSLDSKKKQDVEELLKKTPEELSDEVAKLMNFKIITIDEN